ncbi:hypothetical protein ABZ926_17935 [Streptomyces litmocidini]
MNRTCTADLRWKVIPERVVEPYVACGRHITAPLMRADEFVPSAARPI